LSGAEVNSSRFRDNPEEIARYLTDAFASDHLPTVLDALFAVLKGQNVSAISRATGLRREQFYRSFSGVTGPDLPRLLKILDALDVQLVVAPRAAPKPKIPLPKLGRPPKPRPR
jgi:probable addiction module antidote protein